MCNVFGLNLIFFFEIPIQNEKKKMSDEIDPFLTAWTFFFLFVCLTCNHVLTTHCNTLLQYVKMWCWPKLLRGNPHSENERELECETVYSISERNVNSRSIWFIYSVSIKRRHKQCFLSAFFVRSFNQSICIFVRAWDCLCYAHLKMKKK